MCVCHCLNNGQCYFFVYIILIKARVTLGWLFVSEVIFVMLVRFLCVCFFFCFFFFFFFFFFKYPNNNPCDLNLTLPVSSVQP